MTTARLTFVAGGSVSDYSDTSSLQSSIAREAGVSSSAVVIIVEAASVRITASITLEAGATVAVMEALGNSFATPDAASALLGITVFSVSLKATYDDAHSPPPPPSPLLRSSPPPSPPPSLPPVSSLDMKFLALLPICALLVAALVLLYRRHFRLSQARETAPTRSFRETEQTSTCR